MLQYLKAELSRGRIAQESTVGKKIWSSIQPRYLLVTKSSVSLYVHPIILGDVKDMLWSIDSCQKVFCWPVSHDFIAGSDIPLIERTNFLKLSADQSLVFNWSRTQTYFYRLSTVPYFFLRSFRYTASSVTGILIFKCTEGAGVGDYSSGGEGREK